ncbi:FkbM family methyltransferase [Limibacter armeniacum]|uniref:FkbM family methyltransferase n=1 Tax=Limibacter armeniacum TaxID=466084 RepID=UPI002FE683B3
MNFFAKLLQPFLGSVRAKRLDLLFSAAGDLFMYKDSYLHQTGWGVSFLQKRPVNKDQCPIPWVTYSFIEFIRPRLHKELNIFEYGSGNSTAFYAERCNSVTSVEHDEEWIKEVKEMLPTNAQLLFRNLKEDPTSYYNAAPESGKQYDIIIVDGRDRVACTKASVSALSSSGILVLDDTERASYQEAIDFMTEKGFKKIDFWGMAPGMVYNKCTTIFYKVDNCLNI